MQRMPEGGRFADIYLGLQSRRSGKVKGESVAADHKDEIHVLGWSWGVAAGSALGSSQTTGRRSYRHLVVTKTVDASSTALMNVVKSNDDFKEAKLCMRKAGEGQRDYLTITLSDARIATLDIDCGADGVVVERVAFSFGHVQVDYEIQKADGQRGGGTTFQDEILPK